jgi:hypothetical protein
MAECYCAKIEDGVVTQVIVCGNPEWAATHLGGEWVCTDGRLVGIGWVLEDGEIVPPPAPEIEDEDAE